METLQILREHVESSQDLKNAAEFFEILNTAKTYLQNQQCNDQIKVARCIDIEGIDGVGKTTLAKALACSPRISGYLLAFPSNMRSFRPYFDKQVELVKRNFFHLCDILVSRELLSSSDKTVAILDRYWPTTFAYSQADQLNTKSFDVNTRWPLYIVQPSHIVYLYLNEEERRRRIAERHVTVSTTDEEKRIAYDSEFRSQLDRLYRQVPSIHPIDGNQPTEKIIDEVLEWFGISSTNTI